MCFFYRRKFRTIMEKNAYILLLHSVYCIHINIDDNNNNNNNNKIMIIIMIMIKQ